MKMYGLQTYEINEALLFSDENIFDEFMKTLNNAFVVFYQTKGYDDYAKGIQECIQQLYTQRDEYIKKIKEASNIEKSLDNQE